jgi:hypothetical protein
MRATTGGWRRAAVHSSSAGGAATVPSRWVADGGLEQFDDVAPEEWEIWMGLNARPADAIAQYPAIERLDYDESLDQVEAVAPIKPMPLAVLTADVTFVDQIRTRCPRHPAKP